MTDMDPHFAAEHPTTAHTRDGSKPIIRVAGGEVALSEYPLTTGPLIDVTQELERLVRTPSVDLVVTANVDQVLALSRYPQLAAAYAIAAMRLIDGMPIVYLARLLGAESVYRHTGADLLPHCAALARERGWRIVITGGTDDIGHRAVRRLRAAHPEADIRHVSFPMINSVDDPAAWSVIRDLHHLTPDIVFLCLGSPKQEDWFLRWRRHLPSGVYVGTGAAVDFAAGARVRAPAWVQVCGFEWLWRLAQEPRRLMHRYLVQGPRFIAVITRSWKQRKS